MQEAVKGMVLGLSGDQLVNIMEVARVAARYAGEDVKTAFENITNALGTNLPRALVRYGLITKEESLKVSQAIKQGETDITLYNLAIARGEVNVEKFGGAQANMSEQLQRNRAILKDYQEAWGKFLITAGAPALQWAEAMFVMFSRFDPGPLIDKIKGLWGGGKPPETVAQGTGTGTGSGVAAQNLKNAQDALNIAMRADSSRVASAKSALEVMKAANKDYYAEQELNIKYNEELIKFTAGNELESQLTSIHAREGLLTEYKDRAITEITAEAQARSREDKLKLSDKAFINNKLIALNADTHLKSLTLAQEAAIKEKEIYETTFFGGMEKGYNDMIKEYTNTGKQMADVTKTVFNDMTDALVTFVKTGKLDFSSLIDNMITGLIKMQMQALQVNLFGGATGGSGGGLLGSLFSSISGLFTENTIWHGGGVVGEDYAPTRSMPTYAFANAPRFHGGLLPSEYPAILQKGEGVFTKGQMQAIGSQDKEATTTNNNFVITAVDAKSFNDMCRRNPAAIVGPVMSSLKDNKIRTDMRSLLK
jgi:hypothetical protein